MKSPLEGSVLITQRVDLKLIVREELKAMGVSNISSFSSVEELNQNIEKLDNFLVVIDWDLGVTDAIKMMQLIRKNENTALNPIFVIATVATKILVSTSLNFVFILVLKSVMCYFFGSDVKMIL